MRFIPRTLKALFWFSLLLLNPGLSSYNSIFFQLTTAGEWQGLRCQACAPDFIMPCTALSFILCLHPGIVLDVNIPIAHRSTKLLFLPI